MLKGFNKRVTKGLSIVGKYLMASAMLLTSLTMTPIQAKAVDLYNEGTSSVEKSFNVTSWGSSHHSYFLKIDRTAGFCLDMGKSFRSGVQLARTGSISNANIVQAMNYYYDEPTEFRYWVAQTLIWGYREGEISSPTDGYYNAGGFEGYTASQVILNVMNAAGVELPDHGYGAIGQINSHIKDVDATSSSGSYYVYDSGMSSWQTVATKESGSPVTLGGDKTSATEKYTATEKVTVNLTKTDDETSNGLQNTTFDFYRDDKKNRN